MALDDRTPTEEAEEFRSRNIAESQKVIDARERDQDAGEVPGPPVNDPRHNHPNINQGMRRNVPTGGSTGGQQQGKPRP